MIADANALEYVLHRSVGEVWTLGDSGVRVRVVGALRPGLLQGELVTSERHFLRAFPRAEGFRFFLIETPPGKRGRGRGGARVAARRLRLRRRARGGPARGLPPRSRTPTSPPSRRSARSGCCSARSGIGAVLVRNAFEQRRELALAARRRLPRRATCGRWCSPRPALLLFLGLAIGSGAALVAILPALADRATLPSLAPVLLLLVVVAGAGLAVSRIASDVVLRLPLLESLRSE